MGEPLFNTEALVELVRQAVREELRAERELRAPETAASPASEWLTIAEAALHMKVHQNTIRKWIKARLLPARPIGRGWRIARADLDACVASGGVPDGKYNPQKNAADAMARLRNRGRAPR
jgi:excisionase family DNA binding protein